MNAGPAPVDHPHLHRVEGVRGGNVVVRRTRIGVHDVVGLLQNGETVDSIVSRCFPDLTRAQVYACLAYYKDHRGEIDVLIARQMATAEPLHLRRLQRLQRWTFGSIALALLGVVAWWSSTRLPPGTLREILLTAGIAATGFGLYGAIGWLLVRYVVKWEERREALRDRDSSEDTR